MRGYGGGGGAGEAAAGPLAHISDTAFLVAYFRHLESSRPDPLFSDPYAELLAGPKGAEMARHMPYALGQAWPITTRTAVFDEILLRTLTAFPLGAVINLGAGLDTRPYRLPIPPSIRWVEVDVGEVVQYKNAMLAGAEAACTVHRIAVSDIGDPVERQALWSRIPWSQSGSLVLSEGMLIYLAPQSVADLARDLASLPLVRLWLIDVVSVSLLGWMRRGSGSGLGMPGRSAFQFGSDDAPAFFAPCGWASTERRSLMEEVCRLRREPPYPAARFRGVPGDRHGHSRGLDSEILLLQSGFVQASR